MLLGAQERSALGRIERPGLAPRIDPIAPAEQGAPLLGGHDARRAGVGVFIQDQRIGEERGDHVRRDGRQGGLGQVLGADARRQAHRGRCPTRFERQKSTIAHARQHQHLAWKNQVWVADLL